jgi:hypothetical protein
MKMLQLCTFVLLAGAIAITCGYAQVAAPVQGPTYDTGASGTGATGAGGFGTRPSGTGAAGYGPGAYGPGGFGPGAYGPGAYGPGAYGPGAYRDAGPLVQGAGGLSGTSVGGTGAPTAPRP